MEIKKDNGYKKREKRGEKNNNYKCEERGE